MLTCPYLPLLAHTCPYPDPNQVARDGAPPAPRLAVVQVETGTFARAPAAFVVTAATTAAAAAAASTAAAATSEVDRKFLFKAPLSRGCEDLCETSRVSRDRL